jgi:heat shock protein HslJ
MRVYKMNNMKFLLLISGFALFTLNLFSCHSPSKNKKTDVASNGNEVPVLQNSMNSQDSLQEKYWKLIELNGQAVTADQDHRREQHIIFKIADNRVIGSGGCNNLTGSYELKGNNQIAISKIASTKMACAHMDTETQFFRVLEIADNYYVRNDTLQLNKARMAPLAKFVAVYLK